jgi:hypothetical protein
MAFITLEQLGQVSEAIKGEVAKKLAKDVLVTTLDNTGTDTQIASAKAVFDFVTSAAGGSGGGLKLEVVAALPDTGDAETIYLVADGATAYTMHFYSGGQWYGLGPDLSKYWSKEELKASTDAEVQAIIDNVTTEG